MNQEFMSFVVGGLTGVLTGLGALAVYYAATQQNRLTATTVAADWLRDLRAWASEAVDVLAEASYLCQRDDTASALQEQNRILRCRYNLRGLIDRGRFFLPNEHEKEYGDHKPEAYKGYRHLALDALVAAEQILSGKANLFSFPDRKSALIGVQREFVSIMQAILDPRSMNKAIAVSIRRVCDDRKKDSSLGGLLPDPNKVPEGAESLLFAASCRFDESI